MVETNFQASSRNVSSPRTLSLLPFLLGQATLQQGFRPKWTQQALGLSSCNALEPAPMVYWPSSLGPSWLFCTFHTLSCSATYSWAWRPQVALCLVEYALVVRQWGAFGTEVETG